MPLIMGSATVPSGTTGTFLFTVPPSFCSVTFYNVATATVWLGGSTAVTSANGMQCHSIPVSFQTFMGSKGGGIYGTTGSTAAASAATVQYIIATDF
jgi:hypothetical protein